MSNEVAGEVREGSRHRVQPHKDRIDRATQVTAGAAGFLLLIQSGVRPDFDALNIPQHNRRAGACRMSLKDADAREVAV
jgi:hypothetical protein